MRNETVYGNGFFTMVKATLLALAVSLLSAVVFAVIIRAVPCGAGTIYTVNQAIKALALAVGVLAFVRGEKGWLKGGGTGLLFTALSYLSFSAIGGDFSLSWLILLEVATAFLVGAISGILTVNLKK